jgi:CheY-like chemotaxis protein
MPTPLEGETGLTRSTLLDRPVREELRILLVDDDSDIRECVAELLRCHGAEVTTARSGSEGFATFLRERPDLVLSDLSMPDGDGFALIARIRARAPGDGGLIPAIAFSAEEDVKTAIMAGYHAFIAKPFDPATLLSFIDDFSRIDGQQSLDAPWTIQLVGRQRVVVNLYDHVRAADMVNLLRALREHLDAGPVDIIADLRRLVTFAPSIGSICERVLWSRRNAVRSLRIIGGPLLARVVWASACRILGIPCHDDTGSNANP